MKKTKIFKFLFLFSLCVASAAPLGVRAFSIISKHEADSKKEILITSFSNYRPFGYATFDSRNIGYQHSVFSKAVSKFFPKEGYLLKYKAFTSSKDAATATRQGKVDVFFGAYYASAMFEGLDFVFPAVLNNPVHLMMTPDKISQIQNLDDLKNLKGIYSQEEIFSDYMLKNFENLGVQSVSSTDDAYRMLILGDADFMLGSSYHNRICLAEKGLKGYIAFSKTPLWNMPLFFGVSKASKNSKQFSAYFKKILSNESFKEKVLQDLKQAIEEIEIQSQGVVPPMYIRQARENEKTPADELLEQKGQ